MEQARLNDFKYLEKENILLLKSENPGNKVCILGGVHGNEIAGIEAIKSIMQDQGFSIDSGEVCLVICNQKAISVGKRYVEENLNRRFLQNKEKTGKYEDLLSDEIMSLLDNFEICLDIHNSNNPQSEPFIITEENATDLIDCIATGKVIFGFGKYEPGGTDYYMYNRGKIGICVECGYAKDKSTVDFARALIMNFLKRTGNIDRRYTKSGPQERFVLKRAYLPKGEFLLSRSFADFDRVKAGEVIGSDGGEPVVAEEDCSILFAKNITKEGLKGEAFVLIQKIYK